MTSDFFSRPITRRTVLTYGARTGVALLLSPLACTSLGRRAPLTETSPTTEGPVPPIVRTLGDIAPADFFGDQPMKAHAFVRDHSLTASRALTETEEHDLVIVGGGMSGMLTAARLSQYRPVVLEMKRQFGGNANGQSWCGVDFSLGAAYFMKPKKDSQLERFFASIGFTEHCFEDQSGVTRLAPAAEQTPADRLMQEFYFGTRGYPNLPYLNDGDESTVRLLDGTDFHSFLKTQLGKRYDKESQASVDGYCLSSMGGLAKEISAAAGINLLAGEEAGRLLAPGGNAGTADRIFSTLKSRLGTERLRGGHTVTSVEVRSEHVLISGVDDRGSAFEMRARACVLAIPKFVVRHVLKDMERQRRIAAKRLEYRPYLVGAALVRGEMKADFYDMYFESSQKIANPVTDVISANFGTDVHGNSVLVAYRPMTGPAARALILADGTYPSVRREFENVIVHDILPKVGKTADDLVDLRIARYGHALPLPRTGLFSDGTLSMLRKPFRERVFFVEQDNWALAAFETCAYEALLQAPAIERVLG